MYRVIRIVRRRLLQMIPVILGIVVFNFTLLHMAPGDMVDVMAGESGASNAAYLAAAARAVQPRQAVAGPARQLSRHVVRLDLGHSFRHNLPVVGLILSRLPATLLLMLTALALVDPAGGSRLARPAGCGFALRRPIISIVALLVPTRRRFLARPDADRAVLGQARLAADRAAWRPIGAPDTRASARALDIGRHLCCRR